MSYRMNQGLARAVTRIAHGEWLKFLDGAGRPYSRLKPSVWTQLHEVLAITKARGCPTEVYFAQGAAYGGAIKIGFSRRPLDRAKRLTALYPDELRILATHPGDRDTERFLHWAFFGSLLFNEWFRPTWDLLRLIAELNGHQPPDDVGEVWLNAAGLEAL